MSKKSIWGQSQELAHSMRDALDTYGPQIKKADIGASGVGIGWRFGAIHFIVQATTVPDGMRLKAALPSAVGAFPVAVELTPTAKAANKTLLEEPVRNSYQWGPCCD